MNETNVLCGEGDGQRWLWKVIERDDSLDGQEPATFDERTVGLSLLGRLTNSGSRDVYRRDLNYFMTWWQDDYAGTLNDPARGPATAKRVDLDGYLRFLVELEDPEPSAATINRRIAVVSSFYEQACELELRDDNPATRLKRPKINNEDARTGLSAEDAGALLDAADSWEDQIEGTLVLLLLTHGLRVSEAVNLKSKDVQVDGGQLKIAVKRKGMGGKTSVPIDDAQLRSRLEALRATESEFMFENVDRFGAVRSVAAVGRAAGLEPPPHPHILRHTFVAQALRIGTPIEDVRRMAGHSSIRTTQRYARAIEAEDRTIGRDLRQHFQQAHSDARESRRRSSDV